MKRVLLVDDEEPIRTLFSRLLKISGCDDVVCAEDGERGLAAFVSQYKSPGFSLVLSDMRMDRMDGIQMTREIRKHSRDIPIILVTGYGASRHQEGYEAGCNEFLPKPIGMETIRRVLDKYIGLKPA